MYYWVGFCFNHLSLILSAISLYLSNQNMSLRRLHLLCNFVFFLLNLVFFCQYISQMAFFSTPLLYTFNLRDVTVKSVGLSSQTPDDLIDFCIQFRSNRRKECVAHQDVIAAN